MDTWPGERTNMKYAQSVDDRQDELIAEIQMIVGWGDHFNVRRHAMGVTVEAERIPAEALSLTDRIPCLTVVDVTKFYYHDDDGEPNVPVAKLKYGWS